MKNILNLSFKFQFKKKSTILNIIFISLSFLIVLGINTYSDSAINYMENDVYNFIYFKSLEVNVRDEDDRDKVIEDIEKLENVVLVSNFYSYNVILSSKDLSNKKMPGEVRMYVSNNDSLPKIIKGTNFPDDDGNFLICPSSLYATSDLNSLKTTSINDAINMNDFLNKNISFLYKSNNEKYNYDISFKVVGLYENNGYLDANVCFTQENSLEEIAINKYADDFDKEAGISNLEYQTSLFVQIDNLNNVEKTTNQIANLGYNSELNAIVLTSYFDNIRNTSQKLSVVVIILTLVLLLVINFKQHSEDLRTYKLLLCLGYRKKDINKISIISHIIQMIVSLVISFIVFIIFYVIFKLVLNYYPYILNNWRVCVNYKSILSIFIVVLFSVIINVFTNLYRLNEGEDLK